MICHHCQQYCGCSLLWTVFLTVAIAHLTFLLAVFHSHLANSSEHQRQLWAQSRPGISGWFALLPTLVSDLAPALAGSASQYWMRVNAAIGLCSCGAKFPARRLCSYYTVVPDWRAATGFSTSGEGCASSSISTSQTEVMEREQSH